VVDKAAMKLEVDEIGTAESCTKCGCGENEATRKWRTVEADQIFTS
jgi:hypothetical protein